MSLHRDCVLVFLLFFTIGSLEKLARKGAKLVLCFFTASGIMHANKLVSSWAAGQAQHSNKLPGKHASQHSSPLIFRTMADLQAPSAALPTVIFTIGATFSPMHWGHSSNYAWSWMKKESLQQWPDYPQPQPWRHPLTPTVLTVYPLPHILSTSNTLVSKCHTPQLFQTRTIKFLTFMSQYLCQSQIHAALFQNEAL